MEQRAVLVAGGHEPTEVRLFQQLEHGEVERVGRATGSPEEWREPVLYERNGDGVLNSAGLLARSTSDVRPVLAAVVSPHLNTRTTGRRDLGT